MGSCRWQVARDIGQEKPVSVLQGLARLADVPVYVALYTSSIDLSNATLPTARASKQLENSHEHSSRNTSHP